MNYQITNQIQETDINTRKELWDSLFLFINFQGLKSEYPNMWNKDYKLLPLPKSYQSTREKLTKYCQELNQKLEQLINSFNNYFQQNIYPLLNNLGGDKTLAFRCDRLLKNKIIGESSSLFNDLLICELEYRQMLKFKDLLGELADNLSNQATLDNQQQENILADIKKLREGKINHAICQRFIFKWSKLIEKTNHQELWQKITDYLKEWEQGKGAKNEWKKQLDIFKEQIENFFLLGSENITDGKPFFQLGAIKEDSERGLVVATQNRKGFSLNNPYLGVVNLHQKYFRFYRVEGYSHINPRNLYVELFLREDWVWKNYPSIIHSLGSLNSSNHPVYHSRNLG
ncbi:MAG: hypothetical protein MRERV_39c031 [Mycoplasmataceae bacterium RV_VA103A]|nr:MAG: hypothetical protein MRERV_39c031 [Mycoplasmataceae bacterium RV_VA103A]